MLVLLSMMAAAACTGDPGPASGDHVDHPTAVATAPATTSFPAASPDQIKVPVGDQVDQSLAQVAADGSVVVAVGEDTSANLTRRLFLRSADGGQTWKREAEDPATQDATGSDQQAEYVVHGRGGFVAVGENHDHLVSWRSPDGRRWQRSVIDSSIAKSDEAATGLTATPDGFMIIGLSRRRHGKVLGTLLTWTSADGRHWTRHEVPTAVLGDAVGIPTADQLVVGKHEMIMTGNVENADDTDQPNRIQILRSTDSGAHWTKIKTPPDLGGDYRAYAEDLIYVDGQYLLLVQGDGADTDDDNSWDSLVLSGGAHGTSWHRVAAPEALGSDADDDGRVLLPLADSSHATKSTGWLVAGSVGKSPSDGLIAVGDDLDDLRRLHIPPLTGARSQQLVDGVVSDGAAVLIGSDGRTGSDDPMILRVKGSTVTRVRIGDLGGRPIADVGRVISSDNGYRAVGTLNRTPLLWTSPDGLDWNPRPLPARGRDGVTSAYATDVAAGPKGTAMAVGTLVRNRGSRLGVWSIDAKGRPRQLTSDAFVSPARDDYGYLEATDIAHGKGGWVISAVHTANGYNDIWLLHSSDGRHWTRGRGVNRAHLNREEKRDHRTPWTAFRASASGDIVVRQVVPVGRGFVAVGAIFDRTSVRPVAWRSNDGVTWTEPEDLPLPPGRTDVEVDAAVGSGRSVIVSGASARRVAAGRRHRVSWRLDLTGPPVTDTADWQLGKDVGENSKFHSILALHDGFLGVGAATVDGADDARWWRSSDGLDWRPIRVPANRTSGPGDQRIDGVLPSGHGLLLWGWDVPPTGGGDYTRKVPMPR